MCSRAGVSARRTRPPRGAPLGSGTQVPAVGVTADRFTSASRLTPCLRKSCTARASVAASRPSRGRCAPPSQVAWPAVSSASGVKRSSQRTRPNVPSALTAPCTSGLPALRAYSLSSRRLSWLSKQSTSRSAPPHSASTLSRVTRTPKASAFTPWRLSSCSFSASALFLPTEGFTYAWASRFLDSTRSKSTKASVASRLRHSTAAVEPMAPTPQKRMRMASPQWAPKGTFGRR